MCGIAGYLDKSGKTTQTQRELIVTKMLNLMRHRGGDADGVKSTKNVSIGHTRLSIVDLSPKGNQPFCDTGNNFVLSFNGEIYNHLSLRKKYLNNTKISSSSDAATLFDLLKKYPMKLVLGEIEGMYAFSFLNTGKEELLLVLDRFAIKPLYYINTPKYFAWASEIKAFEALPKFNFQVNESVLGEYMVFRHVAGRETLFKNIYKLQAGEYLTYHSKNKIIKIKKYYQLRKRRKIQMFSEDTISSSVRGHMMGDITAGIQLSGGVDSSLITFLAQRFSKKKLHTFSIGLKDENWNEFRYSDLVAKVLGTKHHKVSFSKRDFRELFSKVTYHMDEPLVHPNTIPMYILAKRARKYTKVLLTGEGADEVFYGYNRYFKKQNSNKSIIFSNAFNNTQIVSDIFKGKLSIKNRKRILRGASQLRNEDKISFYDIYTYLPHILLRQDKAGMAANIENRVPFLQSSVVEAGFNSKTRVGKFGGKNKIKEIALKYFSRELVLRRKCGFGLPIADWLRDKDSLLPYLLDLTKHKLIKNYFVVSSIKRIIQEHLDKESDNSSLLFTLICLVVWHDVFIG